MKENADLKSLIRIQALAMLAFADGIDKQLYDALQAGGRLSYEILVTTPAEKTEATV
jgi:hypothetical protein